MNQNDEPRSVVSDTADILPEEHHFRLRKFKFIEPAVVLYVGSVFFEVATIQQFVYFRFSQQFGNNATGVRKISAICGANDSHSKLALEEEAQVLTSRWTMYFSITSTFLSLLTILVSSAVADRYGRKTLLYLVFVGRLVRSAIFTAVIYFNLPLPYFFIGVVVEAVTGSGGSAMVAFSTYLADLATPGKQRCVRLTILEALLGLTAGAIYLCSGVLIKRTSFELPALLSLCAAALGLVYIRLSLAETVHAEDVISASRISYKLVARSFGFYVKDNLDGRRCRMILGLAALVFATPLSLASSDVKTLYLLAYPFCWDSDKIGYFRAAQLSGQWLASFLVLKSAYQSLAESGLVILGGVSSLLSYLVLAFSRTDLMAYAYAAASLFCYLVFPSIRAAMSGLVSPEEQASLFAGLCCLEAFCMFVFEIIFNSVYSAVLLTMPGLVFIVMAAMSAIPIVCFGLFFRETEIVKKHSIRDSLAEMP